MNKQGCVYILASQEKGTLPKGTSFGRLLVSQATSCKEFGSIKIIKLKASHRSMV